MKFIEDLGHHCPGKDVKIRMTIAQGGYVTALRTLREVFGGSLEDTEEFIRSVTEGDSMLFYLPQGMALRLTATLLHKSQGLILDSSTFPCRLIPEAEERYRVMTDKYGFSEVQVCLDYV